MTELPGTRARWGTAFLVAPAGAALLAGTTGWALKHAPSTAAVASDPAPAAVAPGPSVAGLRSVALRAQITADRRHLASLQQLIAAAKAQTQATRSGTANVSSQPVPVYAAAQVAPPASVSLPRAVPAAAAPQRLAPPPPVQATTAASGARP